MSDIGDMLVDANNEGYKEGYRQGTYDTVDKAIELLKEYPLIKAMGEILKLKEQN